MDNLNLNNFLSVTQTEHELKIIYNNLLKTNHIEGDVIEIGCYEGSTSKFLFAYKNKNKNLFLCDTFAGLIDCSEKDGDNSVKNSDFKCDYETFALNVNPHQDKTVKIICGMFPESAPNYMENIKFSFVHLDVDTYKSTINSLNYCFAKVNTGGIITVHDYNHEHLKGVKKAVDEFIVNKSLIVDFYDNKTTQISLIKT